MQLIHHLVKRIQEITNECGYDENKITFTIDDHQTGGCQYEKGTIMTVSFGGRNTYFASMYPLNADTKPAFMYNAQLAKPAHRASAAAIISGLSGFLCFSRVRGPCQTTCHQECREILAEKVKNQKICCIGEAGSIQELFQDQIVPAPKADLIIVTVDGLNEDTQYDVSTSKVPILCIGPSASGIANLLGASHFCPHGRTTR